MISIISIIVIIIIILFIINNIFYKKIEKFQNLTFPEYEPNISNPFGSGEEVNNYGYGKDWYQKPKANGLQYNMLNTATVDPQLVVLPKQLNNTNKKYNLGIINYNDEFCKLINSKDYEKYINKNNITEYNSINLIKKNDLDNLSLIVEGDTLNKKQKKLFIFALNRDTWKNRSKEYNPNVDFSLENKYIESKIDDVNIINTYMINRFNELQNNLISKRALILFGKTKFMILIYEITNIQISNNKIIYEIRTILYRDNLVYAPYFYFRGFVINKDGKKKAKIFDFSFVGFLTTDMLLMNNGVEINNNKIYKYKQINDNYTLYNDKMERNLLKTVYAVDKYIDSYKLENQYACFSNDYTDYLIASNNSSVVINSNNKEDCHSIYNFYGSPKKSGIWDKPCKKDEDCHFNKVNTNYPNKRGKCKSNGYCELPLGMIHMGYHQFIPTTVSEPYCYNCKSEDEWRPITQLGKCCWEQTDKKKYPFLKSPDFAFSDDLTSRFNYSYSENCYRDSKGNLNCSY
jgi:hypothetical protein